MNVTHQVHLVQHVTEEQWKSQFHRMQELLRITEQGQSLYQTVVGFLLFIHAPPPSTPLTPGKHIHLCGFSDRTVMALHEQIVAMQKHLGNTDISR